MNRVTISDIDIPFGRAVAIILKWMLASIPAILVFYLITTLVGLLFFTLFAGPMVGSGILENLPTDAPTPEIAE